MNGTGTQKNDKNDETISSEHKQIRHAVVVFAQFLPGGASQARSQAWRMFRHVPIQAQQGASTSFCGRKAPTSFLT